MSLKFCWGCLVHPPWPLNWLPRLKVSDSRTDRCCWQLQAGCLSIPGMLKLRFWVDSGRHWHTLMVTTVVTVVLVQMLACMGTCLDDHSPLAEFARATSPRAHCLRTVRNGSSPAPSERWQPPQNACVLKGNSVERGRFPARFWEIPLKAPSQIGSMWV